MLDRTSFFKNIIGLLFIICSTNPAFSFQDNLPQYAFDKIDAKLLEHANAVVRYNKVVADLQEKKLSIHSEYFITVLNKKAEKYLDFYAYYTQGSAKIKDIKISIYDKDGKLLHEVKDKEINDYAAFDGYSMISDSRLKNYEYHPTSFPVSIQVSYLKETKNTLSIPNFALHKGINTSVEYCSYEIKNGSNTLINSKKLNFSDYEIIEKRPHFYEAKNIAAIPYEKYMPEFGQVRPKILFSPQNFRYEGYNGMFKTWEEYGNWTYDSFLSDRNTLTNQQIREDFSKIIDSSNGKKQIAKQLYKYVQDNTRYISISIDEGGIQPMESGEVHVNKYGDCKALSFYYKSLLDAFDIPANYVEIHAENSYIRSFFADFASIYQGNHIIVQIPFEQDTTWVDCTSNRNPFGFLGDFTDNRKALAITKNGGKLVNTPHYRPEENICSSKSKLKIKEDMSVSANVEIQRSGLEIDLPLHFSRLSEEEYIEYAEDHIFRNLKKPQVQKASVEIKEDSFETTENYAVDIELLGEKLGQYQIIPVRLFSLGVPKLKKMKNRVHPIVFYRGYHKKEALEIELPDGYSLKSPTNEITLESEYGKYQKRIDVVEGQVIISREFLLKEGNYTKEKYQELRTFFNKIRKEENEELILEKL